MTIGGTDPVGHLDVEAVVVLGVDVHVKPDGSFCQLTVVVAGSPCAARSKQKGKQHDQHAGRKTEV